MRFAFTLTCDVDTELKSFVFCFKHNDHYATNNSSKSYVRKHRQQLTETIKEQLIVAKIRVLI